MERSDEARLAVLIDADNTSGKWADDIFNEIATLGEASVRRIYGDFSGPQLRSWDRTILLSWVGARDDGERGHLEGFGRVPGLGGTAS